jgi:hypothetical protein
MKILVFGNPLIEKDNLALGLIPKLKGEFPEIEFKEIDPTEDLESEIEDKKLSILDVAEEINKVTLINDLNQLKTDKIYSMHDFDLTFNLKLLEKIGKLEEVKIIAVPNQMDEEKALHEVKKIILQISA